MNLQGTYTAIITPFKVDYSFDEAAYCNLLERQIKNNIDGIVVLGTTGEAPTVDFEESEYIFQLTRRITGNSTKLILGLTSNNTNFIISKKDRIHRLQPDAILTAAPYYNKPTQKGLFEHFSLIAKNLDLPIVLYNVPSRSGVNISSDTVIALSKLSNIIGIKEASGDLPQVKAIIEGTSDKFSVVSGSDDINLDIMKLGGKGTISVASNVIPAQVKRSIDLALRKEFAEAEAIDKQLNRFYLDMFIENNPQAVKTLLSHLGLCKESFRLPMTTMLEENKLKVIESWSTLQTLLNQTDNHTNY